MNKTFLNKLSGHPTRVNEDNCQYKDFSDCPYSKRSDCPNLKKNCYLPENDEEEENKQNKPAERFHFENLKIFRNLDLFLLTGPALEAFLLRKRGVTWDNLPMPAFSLNILYHSKAPTSVYNRKNK